MAKATVISCQRGVCTGFWRIALLPLIIGISMTYTTIADRFKDIKAIWYLICYPGPLIPFVDLLWFWSKTERQCYSDPLRLYGSVWCVVMWSDPCQMSCSVRWSDQRQSHLAMTALEALSASSPDQRMIFNSCKQCTLQTLVLKQTLQTASGWHLDL